MLSPQKQEVSSQDPLLPNGNKSKSAGKRMPHQTSEGPSIGAQLTVVVGRVNEPRKAKEPGIRPEDAGGFEGLHAREVTRSDLHFGKVSLCWEGGWIAGCRLMAWPRKMAVQVARWS